MPRTRPLLLALLVALVAWLATTGTAQAHTSLSSSSPAAGSTVADPLSVVVLTFSAGVRGPEVAVTGPDGAEVDAGPATVEGSTVTVPVAPTSTGPHTITWAVTSGDGHDLTGTLGFDLTGPVAAPAAADGPSATPATPATSRTSAAPSSAGSAVAPSSAGSAVVPSTAGASPPPLREAGADAPEDGPNLLVRAVPVLVVLAAGAGGWLLLRRRRAGRP